MYAPTYIVLCCASLHRGSRSTTGKIALIRDATEAAGDGGDSSDVTYRWWTAYKNVIMVVGQL